MNSPYKGKFKVTQIFKGVAHDGLDLVGIDSKQVHSTINGIVEKAAWENPSDRKQGFGLYVRIRKENSTDKYYFGHLSKVLVSAGQKVKIGNVIGIEGSTGYSTGSHCHYCIRGNGLKSQIKNVSEISGIPNKLGTYEVKETVKKTVSVLAREVLAGKWGNGEERKRKLTDAGYNYQEVQKEVNRIASNPTVPTKKTNEQIAREVIAGKWGNGAERKKKLTNAGYNYSLIQKTVNKLVKGG